MQLGVGSAQGWPELWGAECVLADVCTTGSDVHKHQGDPCLALCPVRSCSFCLGRGGPALIPDRLLQSQADAAALETEEASRRPGPAQHCKAADFVEHPHPRLCSLGKCFLGSAVPVTAGGVSPVRPTAGWQAAPGAAVLREQIQGSEAMPNSQLGHCQVIPKALA